jgi:hypothetical protein
MWPISRYAIYAKIMRERDSESEREREREREERERGCIMYYIASGNGCSNVA